MFTHRYTHEKPSNSFRYFTYFISNICIFGNIQRAEEFFTYHPYVWHYIDIKDKYKMLAV